MRALVEGNSLRTTARIVEIDKDTACDWLHRAALQNHGVAEVFPEDKYIVVQQLQSAGHATGLTKRGRIVDPVARHAKVGIAVSNATDLVKGVASVVLTEPGLTNILALVEQGRTIYQRLLTWIVNKISRTILKATYVAIAYVVTGKFVVSAFAMLLLTFMTDFAKIALATDNVRPSKKPETWNIGGFILVSVILGIAMVVETLLFLRIGWSHFGLATNNNALTTFSFLLLLYFAVFSVLPAFRPALLRNAPKQPQPRVSPDAL